MFYDWLASSYYEQTLRVDGIRQREVNIINPSYPLPPPIEAGIAAATNKYLLSDRLQMQRYVRFSAGVQRTVTRMLSVNATYAHTSGDHFMRGLNLNGPVNGVRPDPAYANVIQVVGDAVSRQHTLNVVASINFNVPKAGGPAGASSGPVMFSGGGGGTMMIMNGPAPPPPGGAPNPANAPWNWRRVSPFTNRLGGPPLHKTHGPVPGPAEGRVQK